MDMSFIGLIVHMPFIGLIVHMPFIRLIVHMPFIGLTVHMWFISGRGSYGCSDDKKLEEGGWERCTWATLA